MHNCGTRYSLAIALAGDPEVTRHVVATYNETREPDAQGRPGRPLARELASVFLDGFPVLGAYSSLEEALGGAFRVLAYERLDGPTWFKHHGLRESSLGP